MADVFISYSKSHANLTIDLAKDLEANGLTVWWDTDLLAGESFRNRIVEELSNCKAAIVIWTQDSVRSDYVLSEAERARVARKLIQLRTSDLEPGDLPPPFDTSHVALVTDRDAVYRALAKLGVLGDGNAPALAPSRRPQVESPDALRGGKSKQVLVGLFAIVAALSGWAIYAAKKRGEPEIVAPAAVSSEALAKTVATKFFDALNSGLNDSSLFDSDVRLGKRGLMSRADAANEFRKLFLKYSKINCRPDDASAALKTPQFPESGFRAKMYVECDFTDKSSKVATQRFPIEFEVAANTNLITGLWQSEEMVLWQPRGRD